MAKTSDYMDYLDREIGIAPANSQEEFRAAETIVEIMKDHDLEPTIQEFDSHPTGALLPNILAVVMFFGVLLSGIGPLAMRMAGFLLALVCAVLLIMRHAGRDVLSGVGPASRSQNVIAVHKATGDKVTKGSRPIVVVAHYDTPRESPLFERLAPYQARIAHASVMGILVASVAVLLQIFVFLPGGLRLVLWIVGLIAMLPALLLAVSSFVEKASPCTAGANDNKASVAVLLGLLDKVRPQDDRVSVTSGPETEAYDSDGDQGHEEVVEEKALGIRHGKEVLQELGILPETCEIVYEVPADDQEGSLSGGTNVADPDAAIEDQAEAPAQGAGEASSTGDDELEYPEPEEEGYASDELVDDGYAGAEPDDVDTPQEGNDLPAEQQDDSYLYGDEGYAGSSTEDSESWDYDDTWEETETEQPDSQIKAKTGRSFSGGIRRAFASIRERFSGSGKDGDIAIPRGAGDDVDYSEFEETDWGDDDDWSDETPDSQEELRSISRDELIARRSTSRQTDEPEEPTYSTADDSAADDWQQSGEEPVEEDRTEADISEQIPGELYEEQDDGDEIESAADEQPDGDAEPAVEARTSHDISHDNGPDWSVLEEEIVEEGQEAAPDPTLYRESERQSQSDDDLDLGGTDLVEVEEELDEDQVASAPIRRRSATESGKEDDGAESKEVAPTSGRPDEGDSQRQDPDDGEDSELSWDDAESREGDDEDDVLPKDSRGLDTISDDYDAYAGSGDDDLEEPDPIDDPTWGRTSYVPPRPKDSVARRATLYDVPSPSEETVDPLDADELDDSDEDASNSTGLDEAGREDTQDSERNRSTDWKGGAAVRSDLLDGEDDYPADDAEWSGDGEYDSAEQPMDDSYAPEEPIADEDAYGSAPANDSVSSGIDQGELQDAILKMGDDLLVSHDIWFVATGASSVDHAGIKAFLSDFRQDIRGAFLINLDSVGAGELTVLTSEGLNEGRRADRRLVRLLSNVAEDLHLPLAKRSHDWSDTDATPAMRSRVRAVTVMGVDQNGLPALSHTQDDVPENVDPAQVAAVVRVIAEAIRRS